MSIQLYADVFCEVLSFIFESWPARDRVQLADMFPSGPLTGVGDSRDFRKSRQYPQEYALWDSRPKDASTTARKTNYQHTHTAAAVTLNSAATARNSATFQYQGSGAETATITAAPELSVNILRTPTALCK